MVHVVFDTRSIGYEEFVPMRGSGISDEYNYFKGSSPFQRGYGSSQRGAGIGDVMRGLWRFFLPIIKQAGTTVAGEALNTGQRVLERVNQGEPLKTALKEEGRKGIDNVLDKGGLPKQFGTGRTKGIKRNAMPSYQTIIGKKVKKRLRSDAFGLY